MKKVIMFSVWLLCLSGCIKQNNLFKNDENVPSIFTIAAEGPDYKLKELLANGADVNAVEENEGCTPLLVAATHDQTAIAKMLIKKGADVNKADPEGRTPLLMAAAAGNFEIARLLVNHGANVNAVTEDSFPLIIAAAKGNLEIVKLLIENGANVNATSKDGCTPLLEAITCRQTEIAELLITRGADVNQTFEEDGRVKTNPLLSAAAEGNLEIVKLLVENGAQINCKDNDGNTPIDCAVINKHKEVVEFLKNAKPNN